MHILQLFPQPERRWREIISIILRDSWKIYFRVWEYNKIRFTYFTEKNLSFGMTVRLKEE